MIIGGIIAMTLIAPPVGILLVFGLMGCGIFRLSRNCAHKAAVKRAQQQVYWTPDRIHRTYYS
jgi:hypothetical protein